MDLDLVSEYTVLREEVWPKFIHLCGHHERLSLYHDVTF